MILAPSEIHFLKDAGKGLLSPDPETMENLSQRFQMGQEKIPKVQVAFKDGFWFALNNSYLHILRNLQMQGKCARVCVEVVPLTKVPESVQEGMVVGKEDYSLWADGVTRQISSKKSFSSYSNESSEGSPSILIEQNQLPSPSDTCQAYQDKNHNYRMSAECLADTALLDALESETDASSYTSSDYSDYDNDDEDDDGDTDSEFDNDNTCNVCDCIFTSSDELSMHKQEKKHFDCSVCCQHFGSYQDLQLHKEVSEHWSQYEDSYSEGSDNEQDDDDDDESWDQEQEMQSLL